VRCKVAHDPTAVPIHRTAHKFRLDAAFGKTGDSSATHRRTPDVAGQSEQPRRRPAPCSRDGTRRSHISDRETIRRINHEISFRDQMTTIGGRQAFADSFDPNPRIRVQQALTRGLGFEAPDIIHTVDRLTMQV